MECGASATRDRRSISQRLGDSLGSDYEVMGELGRGGFGIVYLVGDRKHLRYIAVKVMRPEFIVSRALVKRFRREIEYTSNLDHPNILSVLFSREDGDTVYYAMPRVRGKSVKQILKDRGRLPIDEATRILCDTGAGLAHAHKQYVIHRDVKPSNVMIDADGRAIVLDFGLAKGLAGDRSSLSESGQLIGTPEYMSPEQSANARDLDRRTDVYSWGVLGYEMLTGEPPFSGKTAQQIMYGHMNELPRRIASLRPDATEPLVGVIERALAKDRNARWKSMGEALKALG